MALRDDEGPIAVRYPRGNGPRRRLPEVPQRLAIGKGRMVREGKKVAILSLGHRLGEALKAADDARGGQGLVDHRRRSALRQAARRGALIRKLLDHARGGGDDRGGRRSAGSARTSSPWPPTRARSTRGLKLRTLRLPDPFQ